MASLSNKVDVLVVGAGPTGMLVALQLARAGLEVEIVDRAQRPTGENYACALHRASLDLLEPLGLVEPLKKAGRAIDCVAFYEGIDRRAEIQFGPDPKSGLWIVPQERLEESLEDALRSSNVRVRWGYRLDDLRQDATAVFATVEKLAVTSIGYPVVRTEEMVEVEIDVRARFLVGADGHPSHTRQMLGIPSSRHGPTSVFEIFEFEPHRAPPASNEIRVTMSGGTTDSFWPQLGSTCRWCRELAAEGIPGRSAAPGPGDENAPVMSNPDAAARRICQRAPWYEGGVRSMDWEVEVEFERAMAGRFGSGRCWLTGDAGHQTSPVGAQSLNVGLREAHDLANRLTQVLRDREPVELLDAYAAERVAEWSSLLGARGPVRARPAASPWVAQHADRLLPCLPGSGLSLAAFADQLGLALP